MNKKIFILIALVLIIFGGLFGTKFLQINSAKSSRKPPPPPVVTTTQVIEEKWGRALHAVGTINPVFGVILSNEIAGIVSVLHVESGQDVSKGDVLFELDTSTDKAHLAGLVASQKLAQIKFNRQSKLLKRKSTSRSSYDQARAELDIAKAGVMAQQSIINKKLIRAPFSGKLGIRQISLGQYLDKGTQIAPLVSLSSTIVDFALAERYFAELKAGQTINLSVQAYPSDTFKGTIQAINPGLHADSRTIAVRATVPNPDEKLRAGMFADISIVTSAPQRILTLPETAILFNTYGETVYLVGDKDGQPTVQQRTIETGARQQGRIEVIKGLALGDSVVDEGHVKLRNGIKITIDNSAKQ